MIKTKSKNYTVKEGNREKNGEIRRISKYFNHLLPVELINSDSDSDNTVTHMILNQWVEESATHFTFSRILFCLTSSLHIVIPI